MAWFKTKTQTAGIPEPLLAQVRTMSDDLAGRPMVEPTPVVLPGINDQPTEPQPLEVVSDTPAVTAESLHSSSPFFIGTASAEPAIERAPEPALIEIRPAAPIPVPPEALPVVPESEQSQSVTFNTAHQSVREVLQPAVTHPFSRVSAYIREHASRLIFIISGILLLVALAIGGYVWWLSREEAKTASKGTVQVESAPRTESAPTPLLPKEPQYLSDQPNVLSFDTETVTADQIKSAFLQAGVIIQKENLPGAIEFLIRDQKLNPLAFSRFAYLAKLSFSEELLGTLDETFSVYIVIDDARPRTVLSVKVKDELAFAEALKKHERSLAQALDPLFLDMTTAPKANLTFYDGTYLERPVRFANVDAALGLSVDHAVRGKQWILGTSKDSLRAVLDKTGL